MLSTKNPSRMFVSGFVTLLLTLFSFPSLLQAGIATQTSFGIDFVAKHESPLKVTWSSPEIVSAIENKGLRWEKKTGQGSLDFWLQTDPIAIGQSWRTPTTAIIRTHLSHSVSTKPGKLYVRYGCDREHWTTWQLLPQSDEKFIQSNLDQDVSVFKGQIEVPRKERAAYQKMVTEYARRDDVPWKSDEAALVEEIVKQDPTFFENSTPFIGYIQLLYETDLKENDSINMLETHIDWFIGGRHIPPRVEKGSYQERYNQPWQFSTKLD
ncbi:MAG: hypothetical protein KDA65_10250 [Planctomycetaceae bacterium]|nr:hypothetical protein [Planctomycetaceae bacterium]